MGVAVLGTGQMGAALARALAKAGVPLAVGSRVLERAETKVAELRAEFPDAVLSPGDHRAAVTASDIVVLAVDFDHARALLSELGPLLQGKTIVDPTTPWEERIPAVSGAAELAKLLPPGAAFVAAWKTTFAGELALAGDATVRDVLLCGDDPSAKAAVADVIRRTGFRPLDCGGTQHAATLEGMTRMMGSILRHQGLPKGTVPAFHFWSSPPQAIAPSGRRP